MESCDVLLTYEIKNREIENLCLIKRELERRGYRVMLGMQYETFFETQQPIEAKLIVVPGYYRERAKFYAASHTLKTERVVNMLWEQVFNVADEENSEFVASIKPWGRTAVHLAWGPKMQNRLIHEWGVAPDHACITGHIALDFLRGPLRRYYEDRESIFRRYAIPVDKRVHLFISSFSLADIGLRVLRNSNSEGDVEEALKTAKLFRDSRAILLAWFEQILRENPNDIIVYRPHPEEKTSEVLLKLEARQPRFRVIPQESVKQWILVSDKIYNWFSTSVAEVYAAGKSCALLRPIEIPFQQDIRMFHESRQIRSYDEFREEFLCNIPTISVSEEMLKEYYALHDTRYSYSLACDAIERALHDDIFLLDPPLTNPFSGSIVNIERIKNAVKRGIVTSHIMNALYGSGKLQGTKYRELLDNVFYVKEKLEKNRVSEEEIEAIIRRIDRAFAGDEESPAAFTTER